MERRKRQCVKDTRTEHNQGVWKCEGERGEEEEGEGEEGERGEEERERKVTGY